MVKIWPKSLVLHFFVGACAPSFFYLASPLADSATLVCNGYALMKTGGISWLHVCRGVLLHWIWVKGWPFVTKCRRRGWGGGGRSQSQTAVKWLLQFPHFLYWHMRIRSIFDASSIMLPCSQVPGFAWHICFAILTWIMSSFVYCDVVYLVILPVVGSVLLEVFLRRWAKALILQSFLLPGRYGNIGAPLSLKVPDQTFRLLTVPNKSSLWMPSFISL